MRQIVRYIVLTIAVVGICVAAIIPPEKNLRLGKDLAGGVSLVYNVEVGPNDQPDVIERMIDVLKDRVNPQGLFEISFVRQGRDRIEISMPLPSERVQKLRKAYETELEKLNAYTLDSAAFERAMREPGEQRVAALEKLMDTAPRRAMLTPVAEAVMKDAEARAAYAAAEARLAAAGAPDAALQAEADRLQDEAGAASEALDVARSRALAAVASPEQLRAALELSAEGPQIRDQATKTFLTMPSPREEAVKAIRTRIASLPDADATIDSILAAFEAYRLERRGLDDPADLERLLQGAGVLQFRIAVVPGASPDEARLRQELRERGPEGVQSTTMHWYPLNKLEGWYDNTASFTALRDNAAAYFAGYGGGYVAEPYGGQIYLLLHDSPGQRLTQAEGDWKLTDAYQTQDQLGRPAVGFKMDARGAALLGTLTESHVNQAMAIVLDDEVISAPNINSRIAGDGIIQGQFSTQELAYLIKTMAAGSLSAKLGAKPISKNTLAPDLGKDNLEKGYEATWIALGAIGVFMVIYYYFHGVIAMIALLVNAIIVLGCMSLSRAAFTLPGIAGIILTFGTAVDSNVLIYERIREEMLAGNDLRTAVRTAFNKVLSTIIDANMSNLIVCFVLAYVGTQEIKGFGITLGIGVVATMFCALVLTRMIYMILIDVMGVKKMGQLALTLPKLQDWLTPNVDWIGLRHVFFTFSGLLCLLGVYFITFESDRLLDTEFRGGTAVTLQLKSERGDDGSEQQLMMTRAQVADILEEISSKAASGDAANMENKVLSELAHADVVAINPQPDGVTSGVFKIKAPLVQSTVAEGASTDAEILQKAIVNAFRDKIESRPGISFNGSDAADVTAAPAYPIVESTLGANIGLPDVRDDVAPYVGGVVFTLNDMSPAPTEKVLHDRLDAMRSEPDYASTALKRGFRLVVLSENPDRTVKSAAVVVSDPSVSFSFDENKWRNALVQSEWEIIKRSLTVPSTLAGVESFSAEVAATFKATAIVSIALSLLLVAIYVWVRFGSFRYSAAAMIPLFHDVIATVGLIGITKHLVDWFPGLQGIGIKEFKIDLGMVAALLTIIGFSLNDTVVILDRIRELRGKLAYASKQVINDSVNQCMSRTFITAGTTFVSLIVLFVVGGEGVASFSYTMLVGTIVGTYSTVAIAAPIVWQRRVPPPTTPRARTTPDAAALPAAAAQT